jgi:nicotinate dehydrogenase subunit B
MSGEPMDRRAFVKASGALVVSFAAFGPAAMLEPAGSASGRRPGRFGTQASPIDPGRLESWIAVGSDGRVTAYTGKAELGQGMLTAQTQLIAEELCVPMDRVTLIECDTDRCPDQGTTSGSRSTPTNFNQRNLALACATARETLLRLAAVRLGVPVAQLAAADGAIGVRGRSTKRVGYGELVAGRALDVPVDAAAKRKPESEWTVLGKPVMRVDMSVMVMGRFEYVHTVQVPGMLHGAVVRPPSVGATLARVDRGSVTGLPGVVEVVVRKDFVGVVAEKPWQAMQAADKLHADWTTGPALPPQRELEAFLRKQPSRDGYVVNSGDVDVALSRAASVVQATYRHPYQMHGSLGASCAVADVRRDRATIWSPTQSVYPTRSGIAMLLGLPVGKIHVLFTRGAGCYGLNGADTVSYDAAVLSQAVGRPVKVQLTRKDEMAWENFGYPYVIDQRVGVGSDGGIVAWDYEAWIASHGSRPGYDTPGNVITGTLLGFPPRPFRPGPPSAPRSFRNGSNAAPSYVAGRVGGRSGGAGSVSSERVLTHMIDSPLFTGPLRSPSRLQNTFAHESVLDEVAAHVGADPVAYRLRHLRDPRLKAVVEAAAKAAKWTARPSPRPGLARTGVARGRGMSCVAYEGDNGYVAMVAEVEVDQGTGRIAPKRFVVAQDCGPVSNPDGMRNQIEGGALQGMSRALGEEVTWDEHRVTSIDWETYHSLTFGFDMPAVESVLLNRPDVPATGSGETAITVVAAALGNAVFDATGARVRQVPFTAERVKAALTARG